MKISRTIRLAIIILTISILSILVGCKKNDTTLHKIDEFKWQNYWGRYDSVKYINAEMTADTMGRPGLKQWVSVNDATFARYEFDDYLDAQVFYEAEWYDELTELNENGDFSGYFYSYYKEGDVKLSTSIEKRYTGVLLFNGKFHSDSQEGNLYGGAYLFDNTVILAYTRNPSAENKTDIDDFLKKFEYPVPEKR